MFVFAFVMIIIINSMISSELAYILLIQNENGKIIKQTFMDVEMYNLI